MIAPKTTHVHKKTMIPENSLSLTEMRQSMLSAIIMLLNSAVYHHVLKIIIITVPQNSVNSGLKITDDHDDAGVIMAPFRHVLALVLVVNYSRAFTSHTRQLL